jgi:uncharacterized protein (TIGR02001 family)
MSIGALAAGLIPHLVQAQELSFSGTITATSDYVFRSVTFSDNRPALQPYLELGYGNAYAGLFISNVDFGDGDPNDIEVDYVLGYRDETASGLSYDISYARFTFDNANSAGEVTLLLGYPISDQFGLTSAFAYDPDARTLASEAGLTYAVNDKITLSGVYGYEELLSHNYWDFGINYAATDSVSIDLRYFDTDDDDAFGALAVTYAFDLLGG